MTALASAGLARVFTLVDYRSTGSVVAPILPAEEEYYLRQNLVMQLQMAQLGLLRSDQQVFAASLSETEKWITRHFDSEEPTAIAMLTALSELKKQNVAREMPDVSGSSREVRKLLARFHQKTDRGTTSPGTKALVINESSAETSESVPQQTAPPGTESSDQPDAELRRSDQRGADQSGVEHSAAEQSGAEQ